MSSNQNSTGGNKLTVCIDLDGVLAEYNGWKGVDNIGDPIPGAVDFVNDLAEKYRIIIHTTRVNREINNKYTQEELDLFVQEWLTKHGFIWNGICPKPIAVAYVDDRAVVCNPQTMFKHPLDIWVDTTESINYLAAT